MSSGPFSVHATNSIDVAFVVQGVDGLPDVTTPAQVNSSNSNVRVGILPSNPRVAFVDGLTPTAAANVVLSVSEGGITFQDSFLVGVLAAPNRGGIAAGATASSEYLTPTSR